MSPEVRVELERLLSALCDGEMTEAQHARLEQLLQADAECRRHYLEYVDLHARLLVHPHLGAAATLPPDEGLAGVTAGSSFPDAHASPSAGASAPTRSRRRRRVRQALRYGLVAATTLAASLLVQVFWWPPQRPAGTGDATATPATVERKAPGYVATLTKAADCVWESPRELLRVGSRLLPGELRLRRGIAQVRFDSGPELVVEGPAALRLHASTAATVLAGKVVFRADETAPPFDLHTPSCTLVDLGTEYAVAVGPEEEEVHVFAGKVQRTPNTAAAGKAETEQLKAGQARRYGPSPAAPGRPTALDPDRFVRRLTDPGPFPPDPAAGLLAYEGFDYKDPKLLRAGQASGGFGWASPWKGGFARPLNPGDRNLLALNVKEGLTRPGAAVPALGGCFDYTGFTKYYRRLATPIRLDSDGVYYLSFLFRRYGPQADEINAAAVILWTNEDFEQKLDGARLRLNIGVGNGNQLFTHLQQVGSRTPLPLSDGETYLLVAKVVASKVNPDQVFMRVYGPTEPIEREEPGSWSVIGPPFQSDLVFDWLQLHINSKTRQMLDELRLGTTWSSVTAPWIGAPGARKQNRP
jgi:ferric-dicitrate binding protein FerR (iron transport regulator)